MRFGHTSLPFIMEEIARSEARTALAIGITEAREGHTGSPHPTVAFRMTEDRLTREQRNNLTAGTLQELIVPPTPEYWPEEEKGPGPILLPDGDPLRVEPVVTPPLHPVELAALEAEMDRMDTQHRMSQLGLVLGKPPPRR
jgi:hypothetical protein